jgi:hypothetical protein
MNKAQGRVNPGLITAGAFTTLTTAWKITSPLK